MKYCLCCLLLLLVLGLSAQDWKILYENDHNGNPVQGNIEVLKEAIRSGQEIRIAWGFQHPERPKISVEHIANASFLTIQSDSIVHAQISPIYGQVPDFEKGTITLKENLEWVFIGGTNGVMDSMTRNTITGEIIDHQSRAYAFKWFVRK